MILLLFFFSFFLFFRFATVVLLLNDIKLGRLYSDESETSSVLFPTIQRCGQEFLLRFSLFVLSIYLYISSYEGGKRVMTGIPC